MGVSEKMGKLGTVRSQNLYNGLLHYEYCGMLEWNEVEIPPRPRSGMEWKIPCSVYPTVYL